MNMLKIKISVRTPVSLNQKEEIEYIKILKPDIVLLLTEKFYPEIY